MDENLAKRQLKFTKWEQNKYNHLVAQREHEFCTGDSTRILSSPNLYPKYDPYSIPYGANNKWTRSLPYNPIMVRLIHIRPLKATTLKIHLGVNFPSSSWSTK